MSWSIPYTGETSIYYDSYHRICLYVNLQDLNENTLQLKLFNLIKLCIRNVIIIIDFSIINKSQLSLYETIIDSLKSIIERKSLIFSVQFVGNIITELVRNILSYKLIPNVIFIDESKGNDAILNNIDKVDSIIKALNIKDNITIGVSNLTNTIDIEYILDNCNANSMSTIQIGYSNLPNMKLRLINLIHSRYVNSMIFLKSDDLFRNEGIFSNLSDKYQVNISTVISYSFIQFGTVVGIPLSLEDNTMTKYIIPLCHPFTYRHEQNSPTSIYRLLFTNEEMDILAERSEAAESLDDDEIHMKNIMFTKPSTMKLTYDLKRKDS